MDIKKVLVVGAGFMGGGIAQVCSQVGLEVYIHDLRPEAIKKAMDQIKWSLEKFYEKGVINEAPEICLSRINPIDELKAVSVDLVIEAVFEDIDIKQKIFQTLDALFTPSVILASNTSSIPITELASVTSHPERVLGLHFFSPVPMNQAV